MLKIGLTGGIGSGKSFIGKLFMDLGVPVYIADQKARSLMDSDTALKERIIKEFGQESFLEDRINREFLAKRVFGNSEELAKLNAIVHPAVQKDFQKWASGYTDRDYVLEEAAILFESGAAEFMDYVIFVKASVATRVERVIQRDLVTEEAVKQRMDHQMNEREKEEKADYVILNEKNSMILPQIIALHKEFIKLNRSIV